MINIFLTSFQNFRRIRPTSQIPDELDKESQTENVLNSLSGEPETKRFKTEPDNTTQNTCEVAESSEWKWNISDFRKELSDHSKERLDDSMKQSNDFTEHSNLPSEKLNICKESSRTGKESLDGSKESSDNVEHSDDVEHSKGNVKNSAESSERYEELVKGTSETERKSNENLQSLKSEFHLKNPPQIFRDDNQGWKLAVRSLKEPSSYVHPLAPPPPKLNSHTSGLKKSGIVLNELPSACDNMPVILNVFSLSKDPAKQLISNTKQENSVLFTPPCSPPFIQLGGSTIPVTNQSTRFRNENQPVFPQGRENWYKPVQQTYQNFQEYLTNPVQQVNSQNKPVQQVYYTNYPEYLSNPVKQVSSQRYLNKPAQQVVYSNFQENMLKPAQQVASREYLDSRVKPVYYNYQENLSYPVQQVNSQEFLNKPVQQVYYNPPPEYLPSKPVQLVYNQQEYRNTSVASSNPRECLPNPAQDYAFNISQHNPQQIANGVLPLEKQPPSNQSEYEKYSSQRYTNCPNNNEHGSELKAILMDSYMVEKGHSMAKGNGVYTRFKLKQHLTEVNKTSHQPREDSSTIFQTPAAQGVTIPTTYSSVSQTVANHGGASSTSAVFLNTPSSVHLPNEVPIPSNYSNNVSPPKYRTDYGCTAILDGYGKNVVVSQGAGSPSNNINTYSVNLSEHTLNSPTTNSEKQSPYFENSTIYIPGRNDEDTEKKSPLVFLTPRDAKVIELKQRLEEQEATLRKLRAAH